MTTEQDSRIRIRRCTNADPSHLTDRLTLLCAAIEDAMLNIGADTEEYTRTQIMDWAVRLSSSPDNKWEYYVTDPNAKETNRDFTK